MPPYPERMGPLGEGLQREAWFPRDETRAWGVGWGGAHRDPGLRGFLRLPHIL